VLANYDVTKTTAAFTITPAPLAVAVDAKTKIQGDALPAFTGTVTGQQRGDAITAAYATPATDMSPPGTYPITATLAPAGLLSNYTLANPGGTLTVTRNAPPVLSAVTASADPIQLGTSNSVTVSFADDDVSASNPRRRRPGRRRRRRAHGGAAVFDTKDVGTDKPVAVTGLALGGAKAGNYALQGTHVRGQGEHHGPPDRGSRGRAHQDVRRRRPGAHLQAQLGYAGQRRELDRRACPRRREYGRELRYLAGHARGGHELRTHLHGGLAHDHEEGGVGNLGGGHEGVRRADPALTGTLAGFVPGDNVTATFTRAAGETVVGGPYAIDAALAPEGVLANYDVTKTTAAFTITPAPLAVAVDAKTKIQGDALPAFTGTVTGQQRGDAITAAYATPATDMSPPGTYPITATLAPAGLLSNYTLANPGGTLTVTRNAPPVLSAVTASADPIQLGTSNSVTVSFADDDVSASNPYKVTVDWGDGRAATDTTVRVPGAITVPYRYAAPGVYTVKVSVTDKVNVTAGAGMTGQYQYAVVFDPTGGFVTGGGWIDSPAGAYRRIARRRAGPRSASSRSTSAARRCRPGTPSFSSARPG
jgi:hypothetical protein